jgi:hypothetical protein
LAVRAGIGSRVLPLHLIERSYPSGTFCPPRERFAGKSAPEYSKVDGTTGLIVAGISAGMLGYIIAP